MNLSTKPMYGPPVKTIVRAISINVIGTDSIENQAKPFHPSRFLVLNQKNIIETITNIPEITMTIKCIFPRQVVISPPSSSGKKIVTSNPRNAAIENRIGPTTDPFPSLIPQCIPIE